MFFHSISYLADICSAFVILRRIQLQPSKTIDLEKENSQTNTTFQCGERPLTKEALTVLTVSIILKISRVDFWKKLPNVIYDFSLSVFISPFRRSYDHSKGKVFYI